MLLYSAAVYRFGEPYPCWESEYYWDEQTAHDEGVRWITQQFGQVEYLGTSDGATFGANGKILGRLVV